MAVVCQAIVKEVVIRSEDVREYILLPDKFISYEPGQFLQLSLEHATASDYWPESRSFSIASYGRDDKCLRIIVKRVGMYTSKMFEDLEIGSKCTIKYAYGEFILPEILENLQIVCIASGTGITPFLSFLDFLEKSNELNRLKLFYSVKFRKDAFDFNILQNSLGRGLSVYTTREKCDDTVNRRIEINDILCQLINTKETIFYLCGSKSFNQKYKQLLEKEGISNIRIDEW